MGLVKVVRLDQPALTTVRKEVLEMESQAYRIKKHLYGRTPPVEPLPQSG